jgi:proteasome assembly chaperone (PAC2) family protein
MDESHPVRWYTRPELRRPYMVAAWSGMGAVALLSAHLLCQELGADLLGEIDPEAFFSPSQVLVQDGLIQSPLFPESKFFFWNKGSEHDLIILIGAEQPANAYGMARAVLDVARQFGVERIHTAAAMATFVHHAQEPRVWGTATHSELLVEMQAQGVSVMEQGTIGGLNGLLLATARERGIQGLCLLGEIPVYATQMVNPAVSRAVLTVLARMLEIRVDTARLDLWADRLAPQMDQLYDALPEQVKRAIENYAMAAPPSQESYRAEQPLVADEQFFEEIERFLKQRGKPEDEESSPEE